MYKALGVLLVVLGIAAGLYFGLWLCFIGGIVDIINQFKAADTSAMIVAIGVVKILFASFIGWLAAAIGIVPGVALIKVS